MLGVRPKMGELVAMVGPWQRPTGVGAGPTGFGALVAVHWQLCISRAFAVGGVGWSGHWRWGVDGVLMLSQSRHGVGEGRNYL